MHWRRKRAVGHQAVDRRAAQPGGLHHRGQAREHTRRVGADAQGVSPFARLVRRTDRARSDLLNSSRNLARVSGWSGVIGGLFRMPSRRPLRT
jgi:hypothetical protein